MLTTRKQKNRARNSGEADMLSVIENKAIMLERKTNLAIQSGDQKFLVTNHDSNARSNSGENEIRGFAGNGRNLREADSSSEINGLSGECNQRIAREMNDLMSSVSSQMPRTISEAVEEHVLPQRQATLGFGQGQAPQNVPAEKSEYTSEETFEE